MANHTHTASSFPKLTKAELIALRKLPSQDVAWDGMNLLRAQSVPTLANFVSLAFWAYLKKQYPTNDAQEMRTIMENNVKDEATKIKLNEMLDASYKEISLFAEKWDSHQILSVFANDTSWYGKIVSKSAPQLMTPEPFARLAISLLNVQRGESVLDFCSGLANFLTEVYLSTEATEFHGTELMTEAVIVSRIRSAILGDVFQIRQGNSLLVDASADKVFADPPFALRDGRADKWKPWDSEIAAIFENIPKTKRMDWAFLLSAISKQKTGGKTVVLTYDGLLFRASRGERNMRHYLLESGKLEAVIALPQGILPYTNALCDMLVFSEGNTEVKMVDARDCKEKERYLSEMSSQNLDEVIRRVNEKTDFSRFVSHEEIANREYDLSPVGYMAAYQVDVENGKELGDLLVALERGQVTPAAKLEELSTKEETNFQYLMLKDIEDDTIRMPLPYLTDIDVTWDKFCVSEGNLVISRSAPIKLAIVPNLHNKKVLANGNMYFMKLDESKVNPIYVLCYLKSQEGMRQIEYMSKGSTIMILSRKDLQQIKIPMIPMERQMAIVDKYLSIRRHLSVLRRQERDLESQMDNLLEEAD